MDQESRVSKQIEGLRRMPYDELKALWHTMYGGEPPTYNRDFIINRLAYRIQELTFGGLSETARDKMRQILVQRGYDKTGVKVETKKSKRRRATDDMPILGTRLVREWQGVRHEVTVVPGGVQYQGRRYRSLSAVARVITGSSWNGRLFFGIEARSTAR